MKLQLVELQKEGNHKDGILQAVKRELHPRTFRHVLGGLEDHLLGRSHQTSTRGQAYWGEIGTVAEDVIRIINIGRQRHGRPNISQDELRSAITRSFSVRVDDPLVQELTFALGNVREIRLGVNKFKDLKPLNEGIKK